MGIRGAANGGGVSDQLSNAYSERGSLSHRYGDLFEKLSGNFIETWIIWINHAPLIPSRQIKLTPFAF
jgi:hypothetical protein